MSKYKQSNLNCYIYILTFSASYEFISSMISEDYHKVLKNIKKLEERKKKKRSQRGDFDDENEDESVSDNESDRKSR